MKKISQFIVKRRKIILTIFILLAVAGAWFMTKVSINTDMSKYLPDDSPVKAGARIMGEQFPPASSFNLLIEELRSDEKAEVYDSLLAIEHVDSVSYEFDSDKYNKDDYTLYVVNLDVSASSDEAQDVIKAVKEEYESYAITLNGDAAGETAFDILPKLAAIAFAILLVILLIMCSSWIEPFLFLITIAIAILINMGTNIIFENVSSTTNSIASILQLCLSMDYFIMLMDRYRQEKKQTTNTKKAMRRALRYAFVSISSSSITTIVGMLALVFMSFTIGRDMGFVFAKGVLISLICIFTVLPGLILMSDKLIDKTAKKAFHLKMDKIALVGYKARKVIPVIFLALFIGSFILRGNVGISYTMSDYYEVNQVFTVNNPFIVLYSLEDSEAVDELAREWEEDPAITGVNAYSTTLGKEMSYDELAEEAGMDEALIAQMYYSYFAENGEPAEIKIPLYEFIQFIQSDVMTNPQYESSFTEENMAQMQSATANMDSSMMAQELTAKEFAELFKMDEAMADQLYYYYAVQHGEQPEGKIALYDFMQYLTTDIAEDPAFESLLTDDMRAELSTAKADIDEGFKQLIGDKFGRIIIDTDLPEESDETYSFIDSLNEDLKPLTGDYYVIGNSAVAHEMSKDFPDEMNWITILTIIAVFIVIAFAFRSLSIPFILVCIIQCAIFITMGFAYIKGSQIYYLPLLIVQCLLLGSTIDYGILYVSYYREARKTLSKKKAIISALNRSIHTILTSGMILISVTGILGFWLNGAEPAISEILITIATGGICAEILVIFILPGIISALDKIIVKKQKKKHSPS